MLFASQGCHISVLYRDPACDSFSVSCGDLESAPASFTSPPEAADSLDRCRLLAALVGGAF